MLKKIKLNVCPNPDCQRSFENLIIIYDKSKIPNEKYYGCPHCLSELDPTVTSAMKKIEKMVEVEICDNPSLEKKVDVSNCPKYLGYLHEHFKDSIIPIQCLDCKEMSDCIGDRKVIEVGSVA